MKCVAANANVSVDGVTPFYSSKKLNVELSFETTLLQCCRLVVTTDAAIGLRALSIYSETGAHWVRGVLRGVQSVLRCVLGHAGDHRAKWLGTGTRMSRVRPVIMIFSGAEPPIFSNF